MRPRDSDRTKRFNLTLIGLGLVLATIVGVLIWARTRVASYDLSLANNRPYVSSEPRAGRLIEKKESTLVLSGNDGVITSVAHDGRTAFRELDDEGRYQTLEREAIETGDYLVVSVDNYNQTQPAWLIDRITSAPKESE